VNDAAVGQLQSAVMTWDTRADRPADGGPAYPGGV